MVLSETIIFSALLTLVSGIIGYIIREQNKMKIKQDEQGIELLKIQHNYKERFLRLELQIKDLTGVLKDEAKDIRHNTDNKILQINGSMEKILDAVVRLEKFTAEKFASYDVNIKAFYERNPEIERV